MNSKRARTIATAGAIAGTALLGAVGLFIAGAPAVQAAPEGRGPERFPISVAEIDAHRTEIFANVDSNGDGLVSAEEFAAAEMPRHPRGGHHRQKGPRGDRGEPTEEMLAKRDAARAAMEENLFHSLDADSDGAISREEFSTEAMHEARKASRKAKMFERTDVNGDGYLSPEEFPPRHLANLDVNGDGEITRDELPERPGGRSWGGGTGR